MCFGSHLAAVQGSPTPDRPAFAVRIGDRFGKGVRISPRDAMIPDSTDPPVLGRAFGFHRAMDHLGAAIGPVLAAGSLRLWPGDLRTLSLLSVLPGLFVVALLVFALREPAPTGPPKERLRLTLKPFDRNFRLYLLALVVFTPGNSSDAFLLVRAAELGVPVAVLPLLWSAFHVVKSCGNLFLGRAVDRLGPRPFVFLGSFVYAGIYLAFALATEAWEARALFPGYALFYALTEPAEKKLVADLVGSERMGPAYGWYNFAIGIATLPASLVFGALYQVCGALAAFGWGAARALVAVALLGGEKERHNRSEE